MYLDERSPRARAQQQQQEVTGSHRVISQREDPEEDPDADENQDAPAAYSSSSRSAP
jgi:hypothetical protein